jgi:AcrR family transcriptional regulator
MRAIATRDEVRNTILDATDRLLARHGYRGMTMEELAREAGVGKGTLYLHFSSKEDVALSSIDRLIDRVKSELRRIACSTAPAPQRIRDMLVARVLFRYDHLGQDAQSLDALFAAVRPAFLGRRERYFNAEAEIISRVLIEGRDRGVFELDDPLATAHALIAATNALLPYSLSPRELSQRDQIAQVAGRVSELLTRGLRVRAPASAGASAGLGAPAALPSRLRRP